MEKYIQAVFDLKKLPAHICVVLAATGAFIFYAPENWVLITINPKATIFIYAYIAFVISVFIVILSVLISIVKGLKGLWLYIGKVKEIKREISQLDDEEKAVLLEFYVQNKSILDMPSSDAIVKDLRRKGIINIATSVYISGRTNPYKINNVYSKHIKPIKHLNAPTENSSEEELAIFDASRPYWA